MPDCAVTHVPDRSIPLAYDDREIMLDGKKVVFDPDGTWSATEWMIRYFSASYTFTRDTLGAFQRLSSPQAEILRHPNPENRILHTKLVGELNGYMHARLTERADYDRGETVLKPVRAYEP